MTAHSCLILYGNSVLLAGIKAELERKATLELIVVEAGNPNVTDLICAYKPLAVLFDLTTSQPGFVVSLLREQPGLLLIGVDPSSNEMLVLSSHTAQALGIQDLVNIIRQRDSIS